MKPTRALHDLGQSLWLDNITRNLLRAGVLRHYIDELSVTGLTSNPTIFDHAIKNSSDYDDAIRSKIAEGESGERLFFELASEDVTEAADLFRPIHDRTGGVDGWVSLEVSPLLAHDTKSTVAEAKNLHARAQRPNLLIKIPGTKEGLPAIEEAIFAGVPINVTLLFSAEQYVAAAEHQRAMQGRHLRSLFADDPARSERMTAEAAGVFLDYSKNRIVDETLRLLIELAEQSGLRARIEAMFRGEKISRWRQRQRLPWRVSALEEGGCFPARRMAFETTGLIQGHTEDRRGGAGLYRLCRRPHRFLGSAGCLAEQKSDSRANSRRDRQALSRVRRSVCASKHSFAF
jgi:hypothetical protein